MLDLSLSDDELLIVDAARSYLARELPIERLRPKACPVDLAVAHAGMVDLGWLSVGLPEEVGGSGLGLVEEVLIQRELGRNLASPSLLATVVAAHVAVHAGDLELARRLADGKQWAALAIAAGSSQERCLAYAVDWREGDLALFWNEAGIGLFERGAFETLAVDECVDDSVTLHKSELSLSRALHWIGEGHSALVERAKVLLSAALTGLSEHACELATEYAKVREQFGKPIGVFQAVKHRCVDMGVRARLAWRQTGMAALRVQAGASDAGFQAACAKVIATQAAHENARAGIQVHGAIGFQSECDAHWFVKRAHIYDRAGGAYAEQAREVAHARSEIWAMR